MMWISRTIGVVTTAYGAAVLVKPTLLTKPCKLTDAVGRTPKSAKHLARAVGARDLISGLSITVASAGSPVRLALATRAAFDVADAVVFGAPAPDKATKAMIISAALGWGVLSGSVALVSDRDESL